MRYSHVTEETAVRASPQRAWDGIGGDWVVTLGPESHAERVGAAPSGLDTLEASVNAFTRLWLGVGRPSALAFTSPDLKAPAELFEKLDETLLLTVPDPDWDY